jgi:hypothetical protein
VNSRRLVAQHLLDRVGDERRLVEEHLPLVGWSERTFIVQPMSRWAVSFPAVARRFVYTRISSRVSERSVPVSSSNSASMSSVIISSDGWSTRQSMYSANSSPVTVCTA